MPPKLLRTEVDRRIREAGFYVDEDEPYIDVHSKMKARCVVGHEVLISISGISEYGCIECGYISSATKRRTDPALATSALIALGFTPLEDFVCPKTPWKSLCPEGHIGSPSFQNLRRGTGCFVCKTLSASIRNKLVGSELLGFLYLVRFIDLDSTPFLKVGIGLTGGVANRLDDHTRAGAEIIEVVHTTRSLSYKKEQEILQKYRESFAYTPLAKGPWGSGTECFSDVCPIKLTDWF